MKNPPQSGGIKELKKIFSNPGLPDLRRLP